MHEIDAANLHSEAARYVEFCSTALNRRPAKMRVLDYGCGSGGAVLLLRSRGYQAYGADIDPRVIAVANQAARDAGIEEEIFSVVQDDGRTTLADGQFHFICSQQVFEHVADLSLVARELHRVTAPGGYGFHVFPPQRSPHESHYLMPFAHWLPKNRLRHAVMLGYCLLGVGARPIEMPTAGPVPRAAFWYVYSVNHTFYRPYREVAKTLQASGLDTCFTVTNHRRIRSSPRLSRLADMPLLRPLIERVLLTTVGVNVLTRRGNGTIPPLSFGSWTGRWTRGEPNGTGDARGTTALAAGAHG